MSKTRGNNEPALAGDTPMFFWLKWGLFLGDQYIWGWSSGDQYISKGYSVKFYLSFKVHVSVVYITFVSTLLSYT